MKFGAATIVRTSASAASGPKIAATFNLPEDCDWKQRGFTLIELMIVVVLIAIGSAVASLALRDPAATALEREAARLSALLESARAEARASGLMAYWEPQIQVAENPGFHFVGLPPSEAFPTHWLETGVSAEVVGARAVTLGPEPLIGAQRIVLRLRDQHLTLATDGLGPFAVSSDTEAEVPP